MGKVKQHIFVDLEHEGPDQEEDEAREASSLMAFVVLSMFLSVAATWIGILAGRV
ncbi:MAG: hypothetical protein V4477_17030 [Pseudomonadota bacterium]